MITGNANALEQGIYIGVCPMAYRTSILFFIFKHEYRMILFYVGLAEI